MGYTQKLGLLAQSVFQDSSLNIGIGAAPSGTYKFEVTGTAKVSSTLLLGGALSGTSATFSGSVTADSGFISNNDSNTPAGFYKLKPSAIVATARWWKITSDNIVYGDFCIAQSSANSDASYTNKLYFNATGAATFSSSVSTGSDLYVNGNSVIGNSNAGTTSAGTTRLTLQNTTLTNSRGIGFYANDGTQNPRSWIKHITASGSQYVEFNSDYSSASSYSNFVFLNGNVGIGTSTISQPSAGATTLRIVGTATTKGGAIYLDSSDSSVSAYIYADSASGLSINTSTSHPITLRTNGTTRQTITSGGDIYMGAATGASNVIIGSNGTPSANGTGNLQFINSSSYFSWQISAGGTPAGALTFSQSTTNGGSTFSTERMRITSGGQVGINITPGSDRMLQVKGSDATSSNFAFTAQNTAAYLFEIRNDGVIFTGTLSGSPYNNSVTGRDAYLSSSGVLGYLSSTRESKTNINSVSDINWVNQLKPVSFNYRKKDDEMNYTEEFFDDKSFGFIADEVEKVNPDFVFYDINEDGTKKLAGVKYQSMTAILTKIVQEQQIQIQNLQQQNQDLKSRLDKAGL